MNIARKNWLLGGIYASKARHERAVIRIIHICKWSREIQVHLWRRMCYIVYLTDIQHIFLCFAPRSNETDENVLCSDFSEQLRQQLLYIHNYVSKGINRGKWVGGRVQKKSVSKPIILGLADPSCNFQPGLKSSHISRLMAGFSSTLSYMFERLVTIRLAQFPMLSQSLILFMKTPPRYQSITDRERNAYLPRK